MTRGRQRVGYGCRTKIRGRESGDGKAGPDRGMGVTIMVGCTMYSMRMTAQRNFWFLLLPSTFDSERREQTPLFPFSFPGRLPAYPPHFRVT